MRVHALTLGTLFCTALTATFWLSQAAVVRANVDLVYTYQNSGDFTPTQLQILDDALAETEAMWETVLTGYQPGISITTIPIEVRATTTGLASANYTGIDFQGGFWVATEGFININVNQIETFASGVDPDGNFNTGLNYIDELMAHETGHVLGIGTLWTTNEIYSNTTWTESEPVGQYLGTHGLEAYQQEFDQQATYVPVELAGNPGTPNAHWDQLMRSSWQEGNPADPYSLSPLVGITDPQGRDLGQELMAGAIDADYNEPCLSLMTIESMRDLGFTVTIPEDANGDDQVDGDDLAIWQTGFGSAGLQIDSIIHGDSQRDRDVDGADFLAWQQNLSPSVTTVAVPEPSSSILVLVLMIIPTRFVRRF